MKRPDPARERLLAAAHELFTRHGYDAVSVRQLTAKAHANLGAVTYHFGSKRALYHLAIERCGTPFADRISSASLEPGNALDRIETVVRAALDHRGPSPGLPAMILRELANGRALPAPMAKLMKRNIGTIAALIADGQREGTVRAGDPALLALSVVSQPFYFKIAARGLEQTLGISQADATQWARVVDHVASSVRRTIAVHPTEN